MSFFIRPVDPLAAATIPGLVTLNQVKDGGRLVLLEKKAITASTNIDFTTGFDSTKYCEYLIEYSLQKATAANLRAFYSDNGGASYVSASNWYKNKLTSNGTYAASSSTSLSIGAMSANLACHGIIKFKPRYSQSSGNYHFPIKTEHWNTDAGAYFNFGAMLTASPNPINAFRLQSDSGNFTAGIGFANLYGLVDN